MKNAFAWLKQPKKLLIFALALIVLSSFFAGMFNSSFFSSKVSYIEFETERGTLAGLLYMPKDAGANDPRPVIVTTHGYLNTKEMQDAPAVEMARRGYIVLALDMYDHGNARWDADIPVGSQFSTFWIHSQFDAVKYIYSQPFTKKDSSGNAYIAVSGHSMGGFSSLLAMYFDEMQSLQTGYRMIYAGISVGADFLYTGSVAPQAQMQAAFGSRTVGIIAADYDEFFFNMPGDPSGQTVRLKDYPATPAGKLFLGLDANSPRGEDYVFHKVASGALTIGENTVRASQTGSRIIYTPHQTHPWNHFSAVTTSHLIEFYETAFANVKAAGQNSISAGSQIWQFKELFNFIALIGFFILIVPVMSLLLKLPFFKLAVTDKTAPVPPGDTPVQKSLYWLFLIVTILYPAAIFRTLMNKTRSELAVLGASALILGAVLLIRSIAAFIVSSKKDDTVLKIKGNGGAVTAGICLIIYLLAATASTCFALSSFFIEPTVNQILYWAVVCGAIAALLNFIFYYFFKKPAGAAPANYGLTVNTGNVLSSLVTAVCGIALAYITVFLMQAVFKVDFRLWVLAVRVFKAEHLLTAMRYIPFFFIFYFINTIGINANTRGKKFGYFTAVLMNTGGLLLWVILQYGKLFITGVSLYPDMALNAILLFALIPCLGITAVYARKLYEKTNNVYLASFTNAILFTLITCANTAMFWNMV